MTFPEISELVPHSGPMLLLRRVVSHGPEVTVCAGGLERADLFRTATGSLPALLGIELMAQCVAAHGGLLARARGETVRPGLLLGCRKLEIRVDSLPTDREILVRARHRHGSGTGPNSFDCSLRAATCQEPWLEGSLNVLLLDELPAIASLGEGA